MWGNIGWFFVQLWRIGGGQEPDRNMGLYDAYNIYKKKEGELTAALAP